MGGHVCAFCSEWLKLGVIVGKGDFCGKRVASKAAIQLLARAPLSPISAYTTFTFSCFTALGFFSYPSPYLHHREARPWVICLEETNESKMCVCVWGGGVVCLFFVLLWFLFCDFCSTLLRERCFLEEYLVWLFNKDVKYTLQHTEKPSYIGYWILNTLLFSYPIRYWSYWNFLYGEKRCSGLFDILTVW